MKAMAPFELATVVPDIVNAQGSGQSEADEKIPDGSHHTAFDDGGISSSVPSPTEMLVEPDLVKLTASTNSSSLVFLFF